MEQIKKQGENGIRDKRKQSLLRKIVLVGLGLFVFIIVSFGAAIVYNNITLWSNAAFARRPGFGYKKCRHVD